MIRYYVLSATLPHDQVSVVVIMVLNPAEVGEMLDLDPASARL